MGKNVFSQITRDRVFAKKIPLEYMVKFVEIMAHHHGGDNERADVHVAALVAFNEVKAKRSSTKRSGFTLGEHCLIQGMIERGRALARLASSGILVDWSIEKQEHLMLHPALIQAAVKTPLRGEENHAFFEPDEFLANALAFAPANLPFGRN